MEWIAEIGLRDMVLLAVALAAVYLVVMLIKLTHVGFKRKERQETPGRQEATFEQEDMPARRSGEQEIAPSFPGAFSYEETTGPAGPFTVPPTPTFEWNDISELFGEEAATPKPAAHPEPVRPAQQEKPRGDFGEALSAHLARSDVESEMDRMRIEMERMRIEMEELRATRRVSPQYAEAMELSQRGLTAQDVADQLGLSLAEAELVQALSRGPQVFEEGEDHGPDGNSTGPDEFSRR